MPLAGADDAAPSAAGQEKTRKALSRAGFLILLNPFGLVQTSPKQIIGAGCRIRTDDLPLTRRLLYQLS